MASMKARVGVVCTSQRDAQVGRAAGRADSYLVCGEGQAVWLDAEGEKSEAGQGHGLMVAVSDGEGPDAADAQAAASSMCRVIAKLWSGPAPKDPTPALGRFLLDAHTRMFFKAQERGSAMRASGAVGWMVDDRLHWAEIGTARWMLWRKGQLTRLGKPWPEGDRQRFIGGSEALGDNRALHFKPGVNLGVQRLREGDQLLAVTDGYWQSVDDLSTSMLLKHVDEPQTAAVAMMERAVSRGAVDHVTVVVVDLRANVVDRAGEPPVVVRHDTPPVRPRWRNLTTEP